MALPDFLEERFPEEISFGAVGGPAFFTTIVSQQGGFEQRNVNWEDARRSYIVGQELKTITELGVLLDFFYAVLGRAIGFRLRDWTDYSTDMPNTLGSAAQQADLDGLPPSGSMTREVITSTMSVVVSEYQLTKKYTTGSRTHVREITKPVPGAVRIFINAALQAEGPDYTLDDTTGRVTILAAFSNNDELSWDGLFDVPCRFDADEMPVTIEHFNTHNWDGIPIVELRLPSVENP